MLIICSECGKEYSDQAKSCPHCGAITSQNRYISNGGYNQRNNKNSPLINLMYCIGIIIVIYGMARTMKTAKYWWSYPSNTTSKTTTVSPSATYKPTSTPSTPYNRTTTSKQNYQQIYDEYSKKLIQAGPTSSINEMAEILYEGGTKMAEYMYFATGTDGQYETYQSWWMKLWNVYLENCR